MVFFFFKQKTAYEMRISDWSSDVCSSDLPFGPSALARYWRRCWAILRSTASSTTERLRAGRRMGNANRPQEPSFTVGIEEEYLLVDCETRDLVVDPPDSLMTRCEQELGERVDRKSTRLNSSH